MKKHGLIGLLAFVSAFAVAAPYPLGTMTCDDMGRFASEAMGWRESGMSRDEAFAKLEARPVNDPVELTNMNLVLRMVYGSYGNSWTVKSAGNVIRSDCQSGR